MSNCLESKIEKLFCKKVCSAGGLALKFTSPSYRGVPDRLVLYNGEAFFAELKRPGEHLRKLQEYRKREFAGYGFRVFTIDSEKAVDNFIEYMRKCADYGGM